MPDVSTVHYDVTLTNVSIAYRNAALIGPEIAPEVSVRRQSDRYFVYDPQREAARQTFDGRAPGAEASEVGFELSADSYYCDDHALGSAIPDEERDNADAPLQPEIERAEFLTDKILLNAEINLASLLRDPANVPSVDVAGDLTEWGTSGSDPIGDVERARTAILDSSMTIPNTLVLPARIYNVLRNHAAVVDRIKYTGSAGVGTAALAELLDVERVLVARAVRNTAAPGQSPYLVPVWGTDAILMHVPKRVSLKSLAPVLTFVWGQATGSSRGTSVQTWREERRKSTMVRVQKYYDHKLVAPGAAFLLRNAIT